MIGNWNSVEKNFEELQKDIETMKRMTLSKINDLENSTNIKKKQNFEPTILGSVFVKKHTPNGYYNNSTRLQLTIKEDVISKLKSINSEWFKHITHERNYGNIYLTISEGNADKMVIVKEILLAIKEMDRPVHEENAKKCKENKETLDTIFKMLDTVGISRTYYDYKTNRSSKKSEMHYHFPSEIRKQVPTDYREDGLERRFKELWEQCEKLFNEELKKVRQEQREKEKKEKEKSELKKLAIMLAKYDLDLENDWDDLLDAVLAKNKYLNLAHYLEKNRSDWSDGYHYAQYGLRNFTIETGVDQLIYDDIQSRIDNWESDGRVFRDCNYNYGVLFGMVEDMSLMNDYETVKEHIVEY